MLRMGDFSRLAHVTVETLQYYDRTGLFKPATCDSYTGDCSYAVDQLARLHRILILEGLGVPVQQIAELLQDDLSTLAIRSMVADKRAKLADGTKDACGSFAQIEARIHQIERNGILPAYTVIVKQFDPVRVLALRDIMPYQASIGPFFAQIAQAIISQGIVPTGPWLALYHHGGYREINLDLEAAIPVDIGITEPVTLDDGRQLILRKLPAQTMATIICCRQQSADVCEAQQVLYAWIEQHGYRVRDAPYCEAYTEEPSAGAPMFFEIRLPVEKWYT